MTARNWYAIANRAGEAEVLIYDEIGAYGITAKAFVAALKPHAGKPIRLRVKSPGGSVFDAVAIYNALKGHPRKVTASIEGLAASAASVIVMAAKEILAAGNSFLMLHNPRRLCLGDADAMRQMADLLDRVRVPLVAAYRRSGKSDAEIEALMSAETWYSADEAKDNGFVDHVDQPIEVAVKFDLAKFGYRHPPQPSAASTWDRCSPASSGAGPPRVLGTVSRG
jgi:ATP-dependent protease ClpP protease subunit